MRKSLYFLLFTFSVVAASGAFAQDAAMIQAARKEGSVVWYTSLALPSSTAIAQAFKTKYTGLERRGPSHRVAASFAEGYAGGGRRNQKC